MNNENYDVDFKEMEANERLILDCSLEETAIIEKIAARAICLNAASDKTDCCLDVTVTHMNGCPLDLEKLLGFDDFSFLHDILGINSHLDHETGELKDFFLPRCAKPDTSE